jgi:hypothetical protein
MTIRHAYYIAELDQTFGDEEYGQGLREMYMKYAGDFYTINKKGERQHQCSKFCGVSRYDTESGVKTILILKDFFSLKPESFFVTALYQ